MAYDHSNPFARDFNREQPPHTSTPYKPRNLSREQVRAETPFKTPPESPPTSEISVTSNLFKIQPTLNTPTYDGEGRSIPTANFSYIPTQKQLRQIYPLPDDPPTDTSDSHNPYAWSENGRRRRKSPAPEFRTYGGNNNPPTGGEPPEGPPDGGGPTEGTGPNGERSFGGYDWKASYARAYGGGPPGDPSGGGGGGYGGGDRGRGRGPYRRGSPPGSRGPPGGGRGPPGGGRLYQPQGHRPFHLSPYYFDTKLKAEEIPKWNGDRDDLLEWIDQVNQLSQRSQYCHQQIGLLAPTRFTERALNWFMFLTPRTKENIQQNWDTL